MIASKHDCKPSKMMSPVEDKVQLVSLERDSENSKELRKEMRKHPPISPANHDASCRKKTFVRILLCTLVFAVILLAVLVVLVSYKPGGRRGNDVKIIIVKEDSVLDRILGKGIWMKIFEQLKLKKEGKEDYGDDTGGTELPLTVEPSCSDVTDNEKFDCDPEGSITQETCLSRGCCWKPLGNRNLDPSGNFPPLNVPYCYFPSNYLGYNVTSKTETETEIIAILNRTKPSGYPRDISTVEVKILFQRNDMLSIKIKDANRQRFEVPNALFKTDLPEESSSIRRKQYNVQFKSNGEVIVTRAKTSQVIFHTDLRRLVYSDQFLQLSSRLPSKYIYGLGVHQAPLLRSVNWKRFTFFNRDRAPSENSNLYGTHPFYLAMEDDGSSNGVFLLNSNAMDVILQPTPAITYRTIGGIFDFYIFLGPWPDRVVHQYSRVIGTTLMPPYWGLGFHLCKYGYDSLNKMKEVWQRTRAAGIPFDTQWNDIDSMYSNNDFTYDNDTYRGLPEFVKELHSFGMHYVQIVDAGVSSGEPKGTYPPYDEGVEMDVFVKNSTGQIFVGKVWNKVSTVFPDFTHPNAVEYWTRQFKRHHDKVAIDGAWIDMNEPSNFYDGQATGCPVSPLEDPIYVPGGVEPLRTKTLCMTAQHHLGSHYDIHNMHGFTEAIATNIAMMEVRKNRSFVISRSSFPGIGSYAGVWSGDIYSTWDHMRWSISSLLNMNIFGIPLTGSDICGFNGNTTAELCARWSALGAFYPFSRNHNSDDTVEQDPVKLGPTVTSAAKNSLLTRYFVLPYIYTLFYRSHIFGSTVARPLFFEYPRDPKTYSNDRQFLLGPALMILPVLESNVTLLSVYFPHDKWYDFYTGCEYNGTGTYVSLDAPEDKINLALRGGYIIPAQTPAATTSQSRLNNFTIIVAPDEADRAEGELFWDDGESIDTFIAREFTIVDFEYRKNTLFIDTQHGGYSDMPVLEKVKTFGCPTEPKTVTLNEEPVKFSYDSKNKVLTVEGMAANLLENNVIKWE